MLSQIKILINNRLNGRTQNVGRLVFVVFVFLFVFIGLVAPNPNKADALFWIPLIIGAAIIGGNAAVGDPTGVATNVLSGAGQVVGGAVGGAVSGILGALLNLLGMVSHWLVELAGQFLTFVLIDFTQSVEFYNNPMVVAGWGVVRDIANWFFILMLIVIAIGTILGQEQYNVKRRIFPLVIVAIFMNFSLFFVALYINVTQLFASFFINKLTSPYQDIGKAIAFSGLGFGQKEGYNPTITDAGVALANQFFVIIFQFFAAFVLLLIAILLIVRVAQLWFHMIMAPLALISTLIPRTQSFFGQWLHGLINWGLFGVFASFFIWLSTYLIAYLDPASNPNAPGLGVQLVGSVDVLPGLNIANMFLRFVTVSMFLMAGMHVAKSMSGRAGAMASDGIMRAAGMAAAPGLAAGALAARGGRRIAAREVQDRSYAQREKLVGRLERVPLVGSGLSAPFRAGLRGEEAKTRQKFEELEKDLTSPKAVASLKARVGSSALAMDRSERAASLMALAKRGELTKDLAEKYFQGSFDYLETRGAASPLVATNVAKAQEILAAKGTPKSIEQMVKDYKLFIGPIAPYISPDSLSVPGFTKELLKQGNANTLAKMGEATHAVPELIRQINALGEEELIEIAQTKGTPGEKDYYPGNKAILQSLNKSQQLQGSGVIIGEKIQKVLERLGELTTEEVRLSKEENKSRNQPGGSKEGIGL